MDKLTSTARKIDIVFKIVDVMLKIAFVACLVCIGIVAVGKTFDLPAEAMGSVDQLLDFGPLTFHVAEGYVPDLDDVLFQAALMCVLGVVVSFVGILCVRTIRAILAPMKEGKPFDHTISKNLRKLGWMSLLMCFAVQMMETISLYTMAAFHHLDALLVSEKITRVEVNAGFDLGVLIIPAVFFLLAYIFKYGEQLQVLSDETL